MQNKQQQHRSPVLMTPKELAEKISRLCQILEFENELLELKSPQSMTEHQGEKSRLVAIYNQQMMLIKEKPSHFKKYPKAEIDHLKSVSSLFYEALDTHFRKLSTVKTVTEGLVKAVADEVAKKNAPPKTYSANASIQTTVSSRNNRTLGGAISLNEIV
ncbi:MAG: hypothetical protein JKY04_01280 [Sneathiella sp.]|nr:hypothetical protein [Sneathiella sp.]